MKSDPVKGRWLSVLAASLPAAFRQGKGPYVFTFALAIIAILLLYSVTSPYRHATGMFVALAMLLSALLVAIQCGMPLRWAVHAGTAAGAVVLLYAVWSAGGIASPRLAWLLVLPLAPFFVIGRAAGLFWWMAVLLIELGMGLLTYLDLVPHFEQGVQHVGSSVLTFSIVTVMQMFLPLIYDHLHRRALGKTLQYQRELENKREELEQALHMREQFIASVSHELRTPMNVILGLNALLLTKVHDRPQAIKVLTQTHQSADHLMTVINDILDYSQMQTGDLVVQPEVFELRDLVTHAFELFQPKVRSMVLEYRIELDPALPQWVHSDRHRLMQVLVNLLGNALKFTHQGSVVLRVRQEAAGVLFSVQDTGIGIPPERQGQIFQRFAQADTGIHARYGGNGLGLAISRHLVHLLGGDMGFDSAPGEGSRFWFRLPLQACEAPAVSSAALLQPGQIGTAATPWRFLVVDDHPVNRLLVRRVLQEAWPQARIFEAQDGQQALALLEQEAVDLVLMDMVMPVMDGIEATRRIRQQARWQDLPVLGLTANANPVDLDAFRAAGLSNILLKPFTLRQLCACIEPLLAQRLAGAAGVTS